LLDHGGVRIVDLTIVICWVLFWAYWLLAARSSKAGRSPSARFAGARVAILIVVVYLARALGFRSHPVQNDPVLAGVGLALFFLGLALAIWARLYIGQNWGMPMTRKEEPELVTTGPYHRVRHPIYTGIILALLGTALATTPFGLIAVAVLAAYFIYSATREESYLAEQFPDTYPAYKRSTKMLVPFVF
jgi:protein-S-isoprenylcysteine O-methyltransferase Ste14